jgi:hypothetical protein
MWYRWTKVKRASNVTDELRTEFELLGETVVANIVGQPHTLGLSPVGPPKWFNSAIAREAAIAWLAEQRGRDERRKDIGEAVEIAILALVAIEALPILIHVLRGDGKW